MPSGKGGGSGNLEAVPLQQQDQLPQGLVRTAVAEDAEGDGGGVLSQNFLLVLGQQLIWQPPRVDRGGHDQQLVRPEPVLGLAVRGEGEVDPLLLRPQPPGQHIRRRLGDACCAAGGAEAERIDFFDVHGDASLSARPWRGSFFQLISSQLTICRPAVSTLRGRKNAPRLAGRRVGHGGIRAPGPPR